MAHYKILRASEWEALAAKGGFAGSPADQASGFVHLSTAAQVAETAARHFAGEGGLVLLTVDETRTAPALKWEPSRGGEMFPHLYRPLAVEDVIHAQDLPLVDGRHVVPPLPL